MCISTLDPGLVIYICTLLQIVGYNVQVVVDTEHHLIVANKVTNGSQLTNMAMVAAQLAVVADRAISIARKPLNAIKPTLRLRYPNLPHPGPRRMAALIKRISLTTPRPMSTVALLGNA